MSDGSGDQPKSVVGYGKPPIEHRFKKGRSGNPKGRPRRANSQAAAAGDGRLEGVAAVKGSHRAQLALADLVGSIEKREISDRRLLFETMIEYKKSWQENFEACDARGEPRPDPLPHPDDIEVNARTGEVYFNGPFDNVEKAAWDRGRARLADAREEIASLTEAKEQSPERADVYDKLLEGERRIVDLLEVTFPDEATRRVPGFNIHNWRDRERRLRELRAEWRKSSGR